MTSVVRTQIQNLAKKKVLQFIEIKKWESEVEGSAFMSSTGLKEVIGLEDVITFRDHAFYGCSGLTRISFLNLQVTNDSTFSECHSIASVELPNLITLGPACFWANKVLTSISLPSVTGSVSNSAFKGCVKLGSIALPKATVADNSSFQGCTELRSITLSDKLSSVASNAFSQVTNCAINLVGHMPQSTGTPSQHSIVQSCAKISGGNFGVVTGFGFSLGADVLEALTGTNLTDYLNNILKIKRSDVALLNNLAVGSSVLDLGTAVSSISGFTHVEGSLIDIIKIDSSLYSWNGSTWALSS
jgi:hypothetical protein